MITPVAVLRLRPVGREGEMLYVSGGVPPEPVTGVRLTDDCPDVRTTGVVMACIAVTTPFTVSAKLAEAVELLRSVTVTV